MALLRRLTTCELYRLLSKLSSPGRSPLGVRMIATSLDREYSSCFWLFVYARLHLSWPEYCQRLYWLMSLLTCLGLPSHAVNYLVRVYTFFLTVIFKNIIFGNSLIVLMWYVGGSTRCKVLSPQTTYSKSVRGKFLMSSAELHPTFLITLTVRHRSRVLDGFSVRLLWAIFQSLLTCGQ